MNTNAFSSHLSSEETLVSDNVIKNSVADSSIPQGKKVGKLYFLPSFLNEVRKNPETRMLFTGGCILFFGVLFLLVSYVRGMNLKASLFDSPSNSEISQSSSQQNNGGSVRTETVYKDQYGNILTEEQVKNILTPKTSTSEGETSGENTSDNNISNDDVVKYPEITLPVVPVDTSKTLYVKESDAEKLIAENRLVKKIVDNRPLYVEPISGAVVELIQPIVRPIAGKQIRGVRSVPSPLVIKNFVSTSELSRYSTQELGRMDASTLEPRRRSFVSTQELGR